MNSLYRRVFSADRRDGRPVPYGGDLGADD